MDKELKRDAKLKSEKLIQAFMQHAFYNEGLMTFRDRNAQRRQNAKHCALIAADLLIKEEEMWQNGEVEQTHFWKEVKKELENL